MDNNQKVAVLRGALEVLGENGERWVKNSYQTRKGNVCLAGAVAQAALNLGIAERRELEKGSYYYSFGETKCASFGGIADELTFDISLDGLAQSKGFENVPKFNDASGTDWESVKGLIEDRLRQLKSGE